MNQPATGAINDNMLTRIEFVDCEDIFFDERQFRLPRRHKSIYSQIIDAAMQMPADKKLRVTCNGEYTARSAQALVRQYLQAEGLKVKTRRRGKVLEIAVEQKKPAASEPGFNQEKQA